MAEVTHEDVERELSKLEKQVKNFRIIGAGAHGKFEMGFVLGKEDAAGGAGGGGGGAGEPATGACCLPDTSCEILSEADCTGAGGTYQGDDTTCSPDPCSVAATLITDTSEARTGSGISGAFCQWRPFLHSSAYWERFDESCEDSGVFVYSDEVDAYAYYCYARETEISTGCGPAGRVCTTQRPMTPSPLDESLWTISTEGCAQAQLACPPPFTDDNATSSGDCENCDDLGNPPGCEDDDFTVISRIHNEPVIWEDLFDALAAHLPALPGTWLSCANDAYNFGGAGISNPATIGQIAYKWSIGTPLAFDVTVEWDELTEVFSDDEFTLISSTPAHFSEVIAAGNIETSVYFIGVPGSHTDVSVVNGVFHP